MIRPWATRRIGSAALAVGFVVLPTAPAFGDTFGAVVIEEGGELPGSEIIEEFAVEDPIASVIDATTTAGSALMHIGTGTVDAQIGSLHSQVEGLLPLNFLSPSAVSAIAGYTDTITFFSEELGPTEIGTLHLEYTLDGSVHVAQGSLGTLSFSLVDANFPELSTAESLDSMIGENAYANHAETYLDFDADVDLDYGGVDPALVIELDIPVTNGQEVTYGAALLLAVLGEGHLDFSQTLNFTGATLSDSEMNPITDATYSSSSNLSYGGFTSVPEPDVFVLLLVGALASLARTRRRTTPT